MVCDGFESRSCTSSFGEKCINSVIVKCLEGYELSSDKKYCFKCAAGFKFLEGKCEQCYGNVLCNGISEVDIDCPIADGHIVSCGDGLITACKENFLTSDNKTVCVTA